MLKDVDQLHARGTSTMTWHCITLPGDDATERAATALIEELESAHTAAGKPSGADVFHRRRGDGSHTFYLSPLASKLAKLTLLRTAAVECNEPTVEDRLVRVRL